MQHAPLSAIVLANASVGEVTVAQSKPTTDPRAWIDVDPGAEKRLAGHPQAVDEYGVKQARQ